ncbi:sigma-54-dependent transcriptional regulator [Pelosinus propionicus]|uniref:Transcriptional regulator containing an AAA-type ATPase domain and a DNA-binding domain n=1 Tax=Pelosinus propionicus DSM 13327 TaxID=1123291 RepID=A0A1I4LZT8_9FIRM|nr:sigma-54-dependent transcriptional regulator [Pelosinus propionicus]SFL96454.1 Transcriptional regulator containing an AAA-type ATPase domain and a DNA-binding domain [Pelosinus propionicus DSM 13327]
MKRIESVLMVVKTLCEEQYRIDGMVSGVSTDQVAMELSILRPNASGDLNALVKAGKLEKMEGKPVLYKTLDCEVSEEDAADKSVLDAIIGADKSLKNAVKQAKAAVRYPPLGLHTLLLGETGVGKSMFAETIFRYAQDIGRLEDSAPFVAFNCADYAHNPQLLLAQLFGAKKGSYTGAERDRVGLVEKANGGILFLDEVHRLSPEGQEMLFYLIDKGLFRSMGEVEEYRKVEVLIICATTENVDSTLLRTFTRRIPMIIKLPVIRERTIGERWELIKTFFKQEVQCIQVPIRVSPNALKAFLLYDCPNNIGQLKSDIKLSCARAFLDYVGNKDENLKVSSEELPEYILKGFVKYKEHRDDLDILGLTEDIIFQVTNGKQINVKYKDTVSIYEVLEQKIQNLRMKGMSEKNIQLIMGLDIDTYIKQYMAKFRKDNLEALYKIVDKKVVDITQKFLRYASNKIGKKFNDKILFGMSIHISSTLERIREGKEISNPNLAEIQKSYSKEFAAAMHFSILLKNSFDIQIPLDEIGFITMFIVLDEYVGKEYPGRVGVIVAMHGASTATSMVEVANRLLGESHAVGYDMPLEKKTETALAEITQLVEDNNEGQGVIMLVDMGSLVMFGHMIYENTAIPIKTIEMASTPMVLEAARKSLMRVPLDDIYYAVTNLSPYIGRIYGNTSDFNNYFKDNVIVVACITGKGTAIKLKEIIEGLLLGKDRKIDIIPLEIVSMNDFTAKIKKIKREKNLIAVVSSIKPQDSTVQYLSPKQLLEGKLDIVLSETFPNVILEVPCASCSDESKICNSVDVESAMENAADNLAAPFTLDRLAFMKNVINEHTSLDGEEFMEVFALFYSELAKNKFIISEDASIGLILHLACTIEKLLSGEVIKVSNHCNRAEQHNFGESHAIVGNALRSIEERLHVTLPESEYYNIVDLMHYM